MSSRPVAGYQKRLSLFTIVSNDYVHGACALINSLAALGFDGEIHVGFQGELAWEIKPNAPVFLHDLSSWDRWVGYAKPNLILNTTSGPFLFIDADCVILAPLVLDWAMRSKPVFCAEAILPRADVRREAWQNLAHGALFPRGTIVASASTDIYFNSGLFAGRMPRDAEILRRWSAVIDYAVKGTGGLFADPALPMADQDCLNAVLQDEDVEYSCISPPAIWYAASPHNPFFHVAAAERAVLHCTGQNKPWRLRETPTRAATAYDTAWYRFAYQEAQWVRCGLGAPGTALASWFNRGRLGKAATRVARMKKRLFG